MPNPALRAVALLLCPILAACRPTTPPESVLSPISTVRAPAYATGEDVVTAMHDRYAGRWYNTLTFRQKTSQLTAKGTWSVQTWYEAMRLPGRLRIDFDPLKAGNGVLYARDSQFVMSNGRVARGDAGINDLLLLGFDIYANPAARTAALLRRQGIDLARFHQDRFDGRPMLVVGALAGDTRRKQFWIDAEHLYFVRLVSPAPRDSAKMQDIRFVNYERRGDAWIAPRVEIYTDGKLVFSEDYTDITVNPALDDVLFDPAKWRSARHWLASPAR